MLPDVSLPSKIVSGGQTGVDQATLRAARELGLRLGRWCPPGWSSEFPLRETPAEPSPTAPDVPRSQRTEWNVRDSDATLILRPGSDHAEDPGTDLAERHAARLKRPFLVVNPWDPAAASTIRRWLDDLAIETLSIGGPSEATVPGIGQRAYEVLLIALTEGADGR